MTRITARQIAVQILFSMETNSASAEETMELFFSEAHYDSLRDEDEIYRDRPDEEQAAYIRRVVETAEAHLPEIDAVISSYAQGWKLNRIAKSTLAVLRCAICEILYLDDIPNSAAINEAVELGKTYDSPQAGAFINGVLGSFLRAKEPGIIQAEILDPPAAEPYGVRAEVAETEEISDLEYLLDAEEAQTADKT